MKGYGSRTFLKDTNIPSSTATPPDRERYPLIYPPLDSLMSEEIFGPLLPIKKMDYVQSCSLTSRGEHPLSFYIFSTNQAEIDESTSHPLLLVDMRRSHNI